MTEKPFLDYQNYGTSIAEDGDWTKVVLYEYVKVTDGQAVSRYVQLVDYQVFVETVRAESTI